MDAQLKRGMLDICVLAILQRADSYGYKIIKDASAVLEITESTLYPILKRLEQAKCLTVYSVEHNGRLRKYYSITEQGRGFLKELENSWDELTSAVNSIKENHNN